MTVKRVRPCACCGYLTVTEEYDICSVCGWEADDVQEADPTFWGGANVPSLNDARANYEKLGASDSTRVARVRAPLPHDIPRDIQEP